MLATSRASCFPTAAARLASSSVRIALLVASPREPAGIHQHVRDVEPLDRRARSSGERMRPYEGVQGALSAETVGGDDGGSQHRRELQLRAPTLRPIRRLLDGLKLAFTIGQSHVVGGTTTERSIR